MANDNELIEKALDGSKAALEELVKKHQHYIFNVALSLLGDADDASDLMQEALIKMVTKLNTFRQESNFRTWLYRIVKNQFLNMKRGRNEDPNLSFAVFGQGLDQTPDELISTHTYGVEEKLLVNEAKLSCMKGMLLCLDREQRLIYILGELFEFPDTVGGEIMEMSRENFRVRLHRAKKQLYEFMNDKCGLVNKNNPCRCARKTAGFIRAGYVDPVKLTFQKNRLTTLQKVLDKKVEDYSGAIISQYQQLFQEHPFLEGPDMMKNLSKLLSSDKMKDTFDLN